MNAKVATNKHLLRQARPCIARTFLFKNGFGQLILWLLILLESEANKTFVGGPAKGKIGRGVITASSKSLVIGAVEVHSYIDKQSKAREKAGGIRLQIIPHANENLIKSFMLHNAKEDTNIRTDGWRGYSQTALVDYKHVARVLRSSQNAHQLALHIHRVFSNLKTWLQGTHHSVDPKYLQSYLDGTPVQA